MSTADKVTSIALGGGAHACQWCGAETDLERTVVPAVVKRDKATKEDVVVKPAIKAPVCPEHAAMVDRNTQISELHAKRKKLTKQLTDPRREPSEIRGALDQNTAALRALGERVDG